MKLSGLALIASVALGVAAPAAADVVVHREVTRTHTVRHDGIGHVNHGKRRVCHTQWVRHHKVRRCTWQRW